MEQPKSVDRRRLKQLARELNRDIRGVSIPLFYRFMYWCYYIGLAHRGGEMQSDVADAHYANGFFKRGYDKYCAKINDWLAARGTSTEAILQVPSFERGECSVEDVNFLMQLGIPFVLRGAAAELPMMRWTLDSLEAQFGNSEIPVNMASERPSPDTSKPTRATNYYNWRVGTLGEVIGSIRTGGNLTTGAAEEIMHENDGQLKRDLDVPFIERLTNWVGNQHRFLQSRLMAGKVVSTQLFVQPPNAYTLWHTEPSDNFFLLVQGTKTWTLAHPYHSAAFMPRVKKGSTYHGSNIDLRESAQTQRRRGFLGYPHVPKVRVTVGPSDLLRLPNWWWHTVQTHAGEPAIAATLRAPCMPNLTSIGYLLMRLLDKDYYALIKRYARGGRVSDSDVNYKIFSYLEKDKNQFDQAR